MTSTASRLLAVSLIACTTSGLLQAQTAPLFPQDALVGWYRTTGPGGIAVQDKVSPLCKPIQKCAGVLGTPLSAYAGGTAYDPRYQAAWVSEGQSLSLRAVSPNACKDLCTNKATRVLPNTLKGAVSGLALDDRRSELWQLETAAGIFAMTSYKSANLFPCVKLLTQCKAKLPQANSFAGGLAYDQPRDLLYIGVTWFNLGLTGHLIMVVHRTKPCTPICVYKVPQSCIAGQITGLAYEPCRRTLYVTNGRMIQPFTVVDPLNCKFTALQCCTAAAPYGGLCMVPGWHIKKAGKNCMPSACTTCPNMHNRIVGGDPSLGNPTFGIQLAGAEGGKIAILAIKVGPITTGLPITCDLFYALPAAFTAGYVIPGSGCGNSVTQPLPLPVNAAFCHLILTAQWVLICPPVGLGQSNALQFNIATS